ncbi:hypothetical protein LAD54_26950 [Klebsiella pneumoniae]|nr:hypothetical protein [Klebsiella pneumoniae]
MDGEYGGDQPTLSDGLKSAQSNIQILEAEAALEIDEPEQKSRSSYRA